jgi:hypothetical protein
MPGSCERVLFHAAQTETQAVTMMPQRIFLTAGFGDWQARELIDVQINRAI